MILKKSPNACIPEFARLFPCCRRTRPSTRSRPCRPSQSTTAIPQPAMLHPSSATTGRRSRSTTVPPAAGNTCPGSLRGVEKRALSIRSRPVAKIDGEDSAEDPEDRSQQGADRARPCGPAQEGANGDANRERGEKNATGSSGAELRRGGPLHPGAR